jgi:DNA-binding transcriptional LysR family regulator
MSATGSAIWLRIHLNYNMNLEQLQIFLRVAEHGSFTKAAETLYISHSTTSRNVSALEEDLGVQLLLRDKRSVRLTPAGEALYREGKKLLERVDAIRINVQTLGNGYGGMLSLLSPRLYSHAVFSGCRFFCHQYPNILFSVHHTDVLNICNRISAEEADLGITFSYAIPEDAVNLQTVTLSEEHFCLVAPMDHPLALQSSVKLEALQGNRMIESADAGLNTMQRAVGTTPLLSDLIASATVVPSIESLFLQVRSGNGISIVPCSLAYEQNECAILTIEDLNLTFDLCLVWLTDNHNPVLPTLTRTLLSHL